jgi:beta-aspartyl-peptidase (threonine type)
MAVTSCATAAAIEKVGKIGGTGGLIALDRRGNFTTPFNTSGMYRGWIGPDGRPQVAIYKD